MYCIVEREMTRSTLRLVTTPPAPFVCFAVVLAVVRAMRVTHVHSLVGYGAARRSYSHVFHPLSGRAAHFALSFPRALAVSAAPPKYYRQMAMEILVHRNRERRTPSSSSCSAMALWRQKWRIYLMNALTHFNATG